MKRAAIIRRITGKSLLLIFIIGWLLVASACSEKEQEKPEIVMGEEKMVEVMLDVHLTEAVLTRIRGTGEDVKEISDDYYQKIFEKHDINETIFDTSFSYYQRNLGEMEKIYEQVIVELNKMQREREMDRMKGDEKPTGDSSDSNEVKKLDLKMDLKEDRK